VVAAALLMRRRSRPSRRRRADAGGSRTPAPRPPRGRAPRGSVVPTLTLATRARASGMFSTTGTWLSKASCLMRSATLRRPTAST
jgi:hypothetical protein